MIQVNTQERFTSCILGSTNTFQTDFQQKTHLSLAACKEVKMTPLGLQRPYTELFIVFKGEVQAETTFSIMPKNTSKKCHAHY